MDIYIYILFAIIILSLRVNKKYYNDFSSSELSIKGIFCLLILFSHFYLEIKPEFRNSIPFTIVYPKIRDYMGQLVVVPFLFFSGYGVMKKYIKYGKNYVINMPRKRILKVWLYYICAVTIYLLFNLLLKNNFQIQTIILSYLALDSIGNSNWYIFAILCMYSITCFSLMYLDGINAIICNCILSLFYGIIISKVRSTCWYDTIIVYSFGLFYARYEKMIESYILKKNMFFYIIHLIILSIITIFFGLCCYYNYNPVYFSIFSILFMCSLIVFLYRISISSTVLNFFGKFCFEIYILQRIPMLLFRNYFYSLSNFLILFIVIITITIFLSIVYKKVLIKIDQYLII